MAISLDDQLTLKEDQIGLPFFKVVFLFITLEGFTAIIDLFRVPSMERNALILGYSSTRILAGMFLLIVELIFSYVMVRTLFQPIFLRDLLQQANSVLITNVRRLIFVILFLTSVTILGFYILFLIQSSSIPNTSYTLQVIVDRAEVGLVWIIAIPAHLVLGFSVLYFRVLRNALLRSEETSRYILLFLLVTPTILYWLTLITRAEWLYRIPGWFWSYIPKEPQPAYIYLFLSVGLALFVSFIIVSDLGKPKRNLIWLFVVAFMLQIGFGFAQGEGFKSIRMKYVNTTLSEETRYVCEDRVTLIESVRNYEEIYGGRFWSATKPPGLMIFYMLIREVLEYVKPGSTLEPNACFDLMSNIYTVVMPIIASLIVLLTFITERFLIEGRSDKLTGSLYASGLLFMSAPSVLLMTLVPDQSLYPLFLTLSIVAVAATLSRGSFSLGIWAGISIYLSIFISFSLLPLLGLIIAWALLDYALYNKFRRTIKGLFPLLGI